MIEDMNEVSEALKRMQEEQARLNGTFNTTDAPIEAKAEVEPEVKATERVENVSKTVSEVVENLPDTSALKVPSLKAPWSTLPVFRQQQQDSSDPARNSRSHTEGSSSQHSC